MACLVKTHTHTCMRAHGCAGGGNMGALLQLQAEVERLQLGLAQAESRRRLAEQRSADAEAAAEEAQARMVSMRQVCMCVLVWDQRHVDAEAAQFA
eukprot:1158215-Pelagomonas_calceolata.AAC.1